MMIGYGMVILLKFSFNTTHPEYLYLILSVYVWFEKNEFAIRITNYPKMNHQKKPGSLNFYYISYRDPYNGFL